MVESPRLRSGLFWLWSLVMAPAARAGLNAEGLRYLRWLPLPRAVVGMHVFGLLLLLHLLPAAFLLIAGFPAEFMGLLAAQLGLAACLLPGSRGIGETALRVASALALGALVHRGLWLGAIGAGGAIALWRVPRVWRLAPERSAWRSNVCAVRGGPIAALIAAQTVFVLRREGAALSRVLLISALGIFLILLVKRVNEGIMSEETLLVLGTAPIAASGLILALLLKKTRNEFAWLTRSLGVSVRRERMVSLGLVAAGIGAAAIACLLAASADPTQIMSFSAHTAAWALLTVGISSRSQLDVRSASVTLAVAFLSMFAIGLGGRAAIGAELALGVAVIGRLVLEEVEDA